MKEYLVYCAGPITGLNYNETVNWRQEIADKFSNHIKAISPMRGKHYLKDRTSISDSYSEFVLSSQKGITTRDRNDVMRCDVLLVNFLGAEKVSIGTVMEIAWADMMRKPIVLVMNDKNIHDHAMIREVSGFIVSSMDEAVSIIETLLTP
jgi:nucleoside 2-deoxyribosyltransferase